MVLDVTDPSQNNLFGVSGLSTPVGLEIMRNYAYVSMLHGVVTVDVSDLSNLTIFGSVQISDDATDSSTLCCGRKIAFAGNHAYVACNTGVMHRGMAVIDISTPSNPNEVSFFGENPHSVFEDASGV